jgi:Rrf2 family transcriptional regulator, iron-sulfur cluster assembly transcription factor
MLCFSKSTGYAIQALACAEALQPRPALIREVAQCAGIPRPYLARIVSRLAHQGIISTRRGQHGGIRLNRPAARVSLLEVVVAVEGGQWFGPCMLGIEDCGRTFVCPLRDFWKDIRRQIEAQLRRVTLADVLKAMIGPVARRQKRLGTASRGGRA